MPEPPAAPVRAVVFDLDGTLYHQGPVRRAMLTRLVRAHWRHPLRGVRVLRILSAYRHAQEHLRTASFDGDVAAEQVRLAAERSGTDVDTVRQLVQRWMEDSPLDVVGANGRAGLADVLTTLRGRGIKLGVLSDYPADAKLRALGVADQFDRVITAQDDRVGAFKPNPRGLQLILDELGSGPADSVYVGDRAEVDGAAAAALDVRCILVDDDHPFGDLPSVLGGGGAS